MAVSMVLTMQAAQSLLCSKLAVTKRNDCLQLEKNKLNFVIPSQLQAFLSHPDQPVSLQLSN